MKKINVAFLVCALMALIMCVAPVSALAYEGSDLASTGERISSAEGGRDLDGGDAENDILNGNKSSDAGLLNGMRERPARYAYGVGGVGIETTADLVAVKRINKGSLANLKFGVVAVPDEVLDDRYSVQEEIVVPVRSLQFKSYGANNEVPVVGQNNSYMKDLLGEDTVQLDSGFVSPYAYPRNLPDYEILANAS